MNSPQDTIAAIATPLGEGGLGVIRVSGRRAVSIVSGIFSNPDFPKAPSHTCHLGQILGDHPIDQVLATLFRAPHSYTGEDVVEISAHGSPFTLRKILDLCLAKGARLAGPGEFTERAFLNGKMDLAQAEAVAELIRAKTDKTQSAALSQLQGSLSGKVRGLRDQLVPLLAHVEVGLDHSDEDHDFLPRQKLIQQCRSVQQEIESILSSERVSKILRDGFRVAFLGRPNVGKSSLLNALLKEDRAIVTPIPGTTRDTLEEALNLNGIPVILTDTAGLRQQTQDPVERMGIERTRQSLSEADAVIGLFDGSQDLTPEDEHVIEQAMTKPHIWVVNKSDLPQRFGSQELQARNGGSMVVNLSAKTGAGLNALADALAEFALHEKAQATEAQWLLNTRHQAALLRAKDSLTQAVQSAEQASFEECVALDLQRALAALGEVIGETTTEELLDQIFSQFCVGK